MGVSRQSEKYTSREDPCNQIPQKTTTLPPGPPWEDHWDDPDRESKGSASDRRSLTCSRSGVKGVDIQSPGP